MATTSKSRLRILSDIISDAVAKIDARCASAGVEFPSLDSPLDAGDPGVTLLAEIAPEAKIIVGAAEQLGVSVRTPADVLFETGLQFNKCSCLRAAAESNVAEILREAGPNGLHTKDIAKKNGMKAEKLTRVLRVLATHHIFNELSPDVFANNRISASLDSGKSTADLFTNRKGFKFIGSNGIAAFVEHITDEMFKSSAYLTDVLLDKTLGHSEEATETSFNKVFNTRQKFFEWLYSPGNEDRNERFSVAMKGTAAIGSGIISKGFSWESLPNGAKVVDVGGGIGTVSLTLAKHFPGLQFVVQDLPGVLEHAGTFWEENFPEAIRTSRVTLQPHNFFDPQPVQDADVFFLRAIIHDWSDLYAIKILRRLREAVVVTAGKTTRLVIVDSVVEYARNRGIRAGPGHQEDAADEMKRRVGMESSTPTGDARGILLDNFGRGGAMINLLDIGMLAGVNGQERTISDHVRVTSEAGWKIIKIYAPPGSMHCDIVAEPI